MSEVPRRCERGFTLVEMTVVLAIVVFLLGTVVGLSKSTADAQKYSERLGRAIEINQSLQNTVRYELGSTVMLFQGDAVGTAYWGLLDFDPESPPITTSALPVAEPGGIFARETATADKTGNALMFARQAWTAELACTSGRTYRIDVYRIVAYYLTAEDGGPRPDRCIGLNLCQFVGEPLADGEQIDRITDPTDLGEVLGHLAAGTATAPGDSYLPVELVWRRGAHPGLTGTLRQVDGDTLRDAPLSSRGSGWSILRDVERSSAGLLYYRHYSVATNHAMRSWGVGKFSVRSDGGDGFPHGLEVQVVGPTSSRQVLLHTTIVTTNQGGIQAHSDLRSTVFVRDV